MENKAILSLGLTEMSGLTIRIIYSLFKLLAPLFLFIYIAKHEKICRFSFFGFENFDKGYYYFNIQPKNLNIFSLINLKFSLFQKL